MNRSSHSRPDITPFKSLPLTNYIKIHEKTVSKHLFWLTFITFLRPETECFLNDVYKSRSMCIALRRGHLSLKSLQIPGDESYEGRAAQQRYVGRRNSFKNLSPYEML